MICLRTWQATEMDGKGNDSLGTFFLTMPSNGSDSIPYVGVSFIFCHLSIGLQLFPHCSFSSLAKGYHTSLLEQHFIPAEISQNWRREFRHCY